MKEIVPSYPGAIPPPPPEQYKYEPFSMSRFLSVWHCECEYEIAHESKNLVYLWEPLHHPQDDTLDETARPRWEYEKIVFYREVQKDWIHVNRHLMFGKSASPDVVILPSGLCVEIGGAQVVWRVDRWFVRWHGYTNSRAALFAKQGLEAWKNV